LETLLARHSIVMRKLNHPLRFEIDGEILRSEGPPLLIELKTSISAADIHSAIGQLHLYRQLIPGLEAHQPVLLVPKLPHPSVVTAIEAGGILVHYFSFTPHDAGGDAGFSAAFLDLCGVRPLETAT
jgi:hypothetical protein